MTEHESRVVDDAMWYLRHGNSGGAPNILRNLHNDTAKATAPTGRHHDLPQSGEQRM
jgi:hypothetical protein